MNLIYVNEIDVQLNQFVHVLIYFQSHVHVSYLGTVYVVTTREDRADILATCTVRYVLTLIYLLMIRSTTVCILFFISHSEK